MGTRWQRWVATHDPRPSPDGHVISQTLVDADTVQRLHRRHALVVVWGVHDLERARTLLGWGVDGIIADDLGLLAALHVPDDALGAGTEPTDGGPDSPLR